ncbi:MAG: hypothetical protein RLW61_01120 [Gammaproteobacteria bacterium]
MFSWLLVLAAGSSLPAAAQQAFAYPNAGQTEAQQSQDRYECHQWAVAQSGFDPSTAAPLPGRPAMPPPPPTAGYSDQPRATRSGGLLGIGDGGFFEGGGMIGDAATGAALGAAGGALAGDAGEGAAIGALASTVFGALTRSTSRPAPAPAPPPPAADYYYQQQAQASEQAQHYRLEQVSAYNRAFGACMTARDYTVN